MHVAISVGSPGRPRVEPDRKNRRSIGVSKYHVADGIPPVSQNMNQRNRNRINLYNGRIAAFNERALISTPPAFQREDALGIGQPDTPQTIGPVKEARINRAQ